MSPALSPGRPEKVKKELLVEAAERFEPWIYDGLGSVPPVDKEVDSFTEYPGTSTQTKPVRQGVLVASNDAFHLAQHWIRDPNGYFAACDWDPVYLSRLAKFVYDEMQSVYCTRRVQFFFQGYAELKKSLQFINRFSASFDYLGFQLRAFVCSIIRQLIALLPDEIEGDAGRSMLGQIKAIDGTLDSCRDTGFQLISALRAHIQGDLLFVIDKFNILLKEMREDFREAIKFDKKATSFWVTLESGPTTRAKSLCLMETMGKSWDLKFDLYNDGYAVQDPDETWDEDAEDDTAGSPEEDLPQQAPSNVYLSRLEFDRRTGIFRDFKRAKFLGRWM